VIRALKTSIGLALLFTLLVWGCAPKQQKPQENVVPMPEVGMTIDIPPGFERGDTETLETLRANLTKAEPVPPFSELPVYIFLNEDVQASLYIYDLSVIDSPIIEGLSGLDMLYLYKKNLDDHFGTDIPNKEIITKDYHLLLLNMSYPSDMGNVIFVEGLYSIDALVDETGSPQFCMIDLQFPQNSITPENQKEIEAYENLFSSLKLLTN
jgi:hypothetical protein